MSRGRGFGDTFCVRVGCGGVWEGWEGWERIGDV